MNALTVDAQNEWPESWRVLAGGLRSGDVLGADPFGRARIGWQKCFADGSMGSRTARLLEAQELRLSEGDVAAARVGLVVNKQLDFGVGGSSYRVRFQLAGVERFRQAAPSP